MKLDLVILTHLLQEACKYNHELEVHSALSPVKNQSYSCKELGPKETKYRCRWYPPKLNYTQLSKGMIQQVKSCLNQDLLGEWDMGTLCSVHLGMHHFKNLKFDWIVTEKGQLKYNLI